MYSTAPNYDFVYAKQDSGMLTPILVRWLLKTRRLPEYRLTGAIRTEIRGEDAAT